MRSSFRLRLALLLALLTGLTLGGFGLQSWWLIRHEKLQRVDAELQALVERIAARAHPETPWSDVAQSLAASLPSDQVLELGLAVDGANGTPLYRSKAWPAGLQAASLHWPRAPALLPQPPKDPNQEAPALDMHSAPVTNATNSTHPASSTIPAPQSWVGPKDHDASGAGLPSSAPANPPGVASPSPPHDALDPGPSIPSIPSIPSSPSGPSGPRGPRPPLGSAPRQASAPSPSAPSREQERPPPPGPGPWPAPDFAAPPRANRGEPMPPGAAPLSQLPLSPGIVAWQWSARANENAPLLRQVAFRPTPPNSNRPPEPPPRTALTQLLVDGAHWHIAMAATRQYRMAIAFDERAIDGQMAPIRNAFLLALPVALVLITLGAWFMATRALQPLAELTETIRRVTAQGLDQRVAAGSADREFVELIEVFNAMLERLERGFLQASRFSADAAHELKTPLAILQGELERLIQAASDGSETQIALSRVLDEVRRLSIITKKLLLLSLADAGALRLARQPVDLAPRLHELIEDTRLLAPHLQVSGEIADDLTVHVDWHLLEQVLNNLVSNAIKYNLPAGWIHLTASRSSSDVFVSISNPSVGLEPEDLAHVFERFYRADRAHGRAIDGVGLGLTISREIVRAHGGDLHFEMANDQRVFLQLVLPRDYARALRDRHAPPATEAEPERHAAHAAIGIAATH